MRKKKKEEHFSWSQYCIVCDDRFETSTGSDYCPHCVVIRNKNVELFDFFVKLMDYKIEKVVESEMQMHLGHEHGYND